MTKIVYMTKRAAAIDRKAAWNLAISEGRVVRVEYHGSVSMQSCLTVEAAHAAVTEAVSCGYEANIVEPSLAQLA